MNKREAIRAMCDGKKVCRNAWGVGEFLSMAENGQIFDENNAEQAFNDYYDSDDWQIYEEPKPKVTYDEAVAARVVNIYWPNHIRPVTYHREYTQFGCAEKIWCVQNLSAFDLADRKGYRMEVVE